MLGQPYATGDDLYSDDLWLLQGPVGLGTTSGMALQDKGQWGQRWPHVTGFHG